jgi:mono/diheme cytochrome c family protein
MKPLLLGTIIVLATATAAAAADELSRSQAGHVYAETYCSKCHGIGAGPSPLSQAPRFKDVAEQPGVTAMSLQAFLQSSHPTMPNIIIEPEDMRNVIAYILSLKGRE